MLPSTGRFTEINCPFLDSGLCERPYCHFRHAKKEPLEFRQIHAVNICPPATSSIALGENGELIQRLVSEAVRKVLEQTDLPLSQSSISCAVTDISRNVVTKGAEIFVPPSPSVTPFVSTFKSSTSQQNIPSYKPTPISLLKNKQNRHIPISYSTTLCKTSSNFRKRTSTDDVSLTVKKLKTPIPEVNVFPSLYSSTSSSKTKAYATESQLLDELSEPNDTQSGTSQHSQAAAKYWNGDDLKHSATTSTENHIAHTPSSRNHADSSVSTNKRSDTSECSHEITGESCATNGASMGRGSTEISSVSKENSTCGDNSAREHVSKFISKPENLENEDLDITKQIEMIHNYVPLDENSNKEAKSIVSRREDEMIVSSSDDVLHSMDNSEVVSETEETRNCSVKHKTKLNNKKEVERKQKEEKRKSNESERIECARKSDKKDSERDNKHSERSKSSSSSINMDNHRKKSEDRSRKSDKKMYGHDKREKYKGRKSDGEKKSTNKKHSEHIHKREHSHKKSEDDMKHRSYRRKNEDREAKDISTKQTSSSEYRKPQAKQSEGTICQKNISNRTTSPKSLKSSREKNNEKNKNYCHETESNSITNDENRREEKFSKSDKAAKEEKSKSCECYLIEELETSRIESKGNNDIGNNSDNPIICDKIIHDYSETDSEVSDLGDVLDNVTLPHDTLTSSDEDAVTEECYRIFQEYEPSNAPKKSVNVTEHIEVMKYVPIAQKQRVAHKGAESSKSLRPVLKRNFGPTPRQVLTDRLKKVRELSQTLNPSASIMSRQCSPSTHIPFSTVARLSQRSDSVPQMVAKKRIAHVPNISVLLNAKTKIQQKFDEERFRCGLAGTSTKAQTVTKGYNRVAHIPSEQVLKRPIITDVRGKISSNVRQTYLNVLVDEYLKICTTEEEAFKKAEEEEKAIYSRSTIRSVYSSHVSNSINRLRKANQRNSANSSRQDHAVVKRTVSHSSMLTSKGAKGSWSIEKPWKPPSVTSKNLYEQLSRFVITENQLKENGYPMSHPDEKNVAVIQNVYKTTFVPKTPLQRMCARCSKLYYVNQLGKSVKEENCIYHWGRLFQTRNRGIWEARYNCCHGDREAIGCSVGTCHVSESSDSTNLRGFVKTLPKENPPPEGDYGVYALDCEMCYTTVGLELTRITVVGRDLEIVYETFVCPESEILDYNTRFSGIRKADLEHVTTNIYEVQSVLLSFINDKTILIGHSLESDFKALKLIHSTVVDTSIVFPHKMGPPKKLSLKTLCRDLLQKIIQENEGGHDSAEDARAAMEIMLFKVKEDMKT